MNKLYFGVPVLCLVLFFGYAWHFKTTYEAEIAAAELKKKEEAAEKALADSFRQAQLIEEQNAATIAENERRRREREAEEATKLAREEAQRNRDIATGRLGDIRRRHEALAKDLSVEEGLLKKASDDLASLQAEKAFLASYVDLARRNRERMLGLIPKVDQAAAQVQQKIDELTKKPSR
jgi:hypothetical protein